MGTASVPLREWGRGPTPLRLALAAASINTVATGTSRILLALCYSTKRRALAVTICRAADLPPADTNGYSDPFVKL